MQYPEKNLQPSNSQYPAPVYQTDSIDFIDLFLILDKRKWIIVFVTLVSLSIGFALNVSKKPVYLFTTTISIGIQVTGKQLVRFETIETVKNKIESTFIPYVLSEYIKANPDAKPFKISVSVPKRSQVIILKTSASDKDAEIVKILHQQIVEALAKEHQHIHNSIKLGYEHDMSLAEIKLKYLENATVVDADLKSKASKLINAETSFQRLTNPDLIAVKQRKLENTILQRKNNLSYLVDLKGQLNENLSHLKLAKKELNLKINDIKAQLTDSLKEREQAIKEVDKPTQAMTLLMIDNKVQEYHKFLLAMENRMLIKFPERITEIEIKLRNNKREQQAAQQAIDQAQMNLNNFKLEQKLDSTPTRAKIVSMKAQIERSKIDRDREILELKQKIRELDLQINNLKPTRAVMPTIQSLRPHGAGKIRKLLFFLVIGFIAGVMLTFYLEFMDKVKQRRATSNG